MLELIDTLAPVALLLIVQAGGGALGDDIATYLRYVCIALTIVKTASWTLSSRLLSSLVGLGSAAVSVPVLYMLAVLLGAPLYATVAKDTVELTLLGATFVALTLTTSSLDSTNILRWHDKVSTAQLRRRGVALISTLAGVWISAFAIPLDWERPWQRWPIPIVFGSALGRLIGGILNLVL
ncbi:PIG-F-domain-containing protein [Ramicandelaber brevisporus]|nr:PIG-F-domain-containing protein [Ramicandelaber brevisporus]